MRRIGALIALSSILACAHGASVRRGYDFRIYDTGGVRVYLSSAFQKDFIGLESDEAYREFFQRTVDELGTLFARGVLTGQMFFDALGETSPETGVWNIHQRELNDVDHILAADPGPLVKILNYEDLSDPDVGARREYDLWVTFSAAETGWGSFHHFTLGLENTDAMSGANLRDFASGARVVRLKYEGMEL